ncbi:MAG: hypothetical protein ACYDC6_07290 [Acidobacteriaceae bacterium]
MNAIRNPHRSSAILLFLAIAGTAWLMLHEGIRGLSHASHHDIALDPGYEHAERLQVATARAAVDALGIAGSTDQRASYRADYRLQRMQIQADSEGLDRWAAHDMQRQGLLQEIRASLAALRVALDQVAVQPGTTSAASGNSIHVPLLPALGRSQRALSNYAASLSEPDSAQRAHYIFYIFSGPLLLWQLLVLLLVELAALAWLFFRPFPSARTNGRRL